MLLLFTASLLQKDLIKDFLLTSYVLCFVQNKIKIPHIYIQTVFIHLLTIML